MPIELISFDLDDTLWPCLPTIMHAENALFDWLHLNVPALTEQHSIESMREHRQLFIQQNPHMQVNLTEMRKASMRNLSAQLMIDDDWVEPAFAVYHAARQKVNLFDDVATVMDGLQQRYRMVAISNGNADIHKTGVAHWFEFHVTADQVGQAKPHPDMFQAVLSKAGVDAAQTLLVGDDPHRDIYGASQLGMRTIWVNRDNREWEHPECKPDATVIDFSNLGDVIQRLEAER
jgi:putative hydrolase of the HAD superfamily